MRWTLRAFALLAALWIAFVAWPFFALYELAAAIQNRDGTTVARRINVPAVRQSLTGQIAATYLRITGREARLGVLTRGVAVAAATSVADPIVAKLLSTDALLELLHSGWPKHVLSEEPATVWGAPGQGSIVQGLTSLSFGNLWRVFVQSEQGLRRFDVGVPIDAPPARRLKLQFRLTHWVWKLAGIELPEELRVRLARELGRQIDRK
jgi:signal transduction histidine kinase